jgi:hypothetical protein
MRNAAVHKEKIVCNRYFFARMGKWDWFWDIPVSWEEFQKKLLVVKYIYLVKKINFFSPSEGAFT